MSEKWEDILAQYPSLDPQQLIDYLEGRLSDAEKHAVEARMADSDFMSDAMEGLAGVRDSGQIPSIVHELNSRLHKKTRERRKRLFRNGIFFPDWLLYAIVITILLVVLGFLVYRMYTV